MSVLFLFVGTEALSARQVNEVSFTIREDSKLRINGTSNVNDFECFYEAPISSDILNQTVTFGDSLFFSGNAVRFQTNAFDCGKRAINRDLQKTLMSDQFPYMELKLSTVEIADQLPFSANLEITIAGTTRIRPVTINEYSGSESAINFSGEGEVLLSDFNLSPPTALFGLVKVDDEIKISFDLNIEL